ncbi:NTP transferase domain-containing protein, partial [Intestinimonas massiliensis (ex Afouda et al. 2020)]|uniref:NTP transferase domain-containing protein n=1 Tax=Intestinimonas massiliensis (ex Afouda et al. 2020) TaxID=1673721 RepID=UPI0034A087F7
MRGRTPPPPTGGGASPRTAGLRPCRRHSAWLPPTSCPFTTEGRSYFVRREVRAVERLGAVILAAGLSSRMGEFKPLLPIGGVSMIRRVV